MNSYLAFVLRFGATVFVEEQFGMKKSIMNIPLLAFLIEDDLDDQKFFQIALSRLEKYVRFAIADSGAQALEKLRDTTFTPNFIFIDINMPIMNGVKCLREIRKIGRLNLIPIYMYSISADPTITDSCILLGATGSIKKTTKIDILKEVLRGIFQQKLPIG
jgi:CheY-like chemotaxis protein